MPRAHITVCLIGFEKHKARPDLSDSSGFWLAVGNEDVSPFIKAFKTAPAVFHEFLIEQRIGKELRASTLAAQIIEIKEGAFETRVLLRPNIPIPFD